MTTSHDIFISYAREDRSAAERFAAAFEAAGLTVWWDTALQAGESFDLRIEEAIKSAKAAVVLWSEHSVKSRWVRAEATLADRLRKLLPVRISPCDLPIMFELTHTAELTGWDGSRDDKTWTAFLGEARRFVAKGAPAPVSMPASPAPIAAPRPTAPGQKPTRPVLAVLPFVNRSGLKEDDIFAIGMVEDIIDALSLARTIRVLSSGATAAYRKSAADVVEIARQANVRYLLEGNVRRVGEMLRVTAQLIDAADGGILWTQKFDRPLSELAALQEDLVMEVAGHLGSQISRIELERALKKPGDLNAWEAILRSMAAAARGAWVQAIAEAERAVALAPEIGLAHATLAFAFSGMIAPRSRDSLKSGGAEYREKAHRHIARALELDPLNPTVHLWVGWSYAWCLEPEIGVTYLEQAVRARPMNSVAHHGLGSAYVLLNRNEEALAEWELAERLAPNSPNQYNLSAFIAAVLVKLGRLEEALARLDESHRLMPAFANPIYFRPVVLELLGRHAEALAGMRRARALGLEPVSAAHGFFETWWCNHPDQALMHATLQMLWDATAAS